MANKKTSDFEVVTDLQLTDYLVLVTPSGEEKIIMAADLKAQQEAEENDE